MSLGEFDVSDIAYERPTHHGLVFQELGFTLPVDMRNVIKVTL